MAEQRAQAYWNTETGTVWIETAEDPAYRLAESVGTALAAYDTVAASGWSRSGNWMIRPGIQHQRVLDVHRTALR